MIRIGGTYASITALNPYHNTQSNKNYFLPKTCTPCFCKKNGFYNAILIPIPFKRSRKSNLVFVQCFQPVYINARNKTKNVNENNKIETQLVSFTSSLLYICMHISLQGKNVKKFLVYHEVSTPCSKPKIEFRLKV